MVGDDILGVRQGDWGLKQERGNVMDYQKGFDLLNAIAAIELRQRKPKRKRKPQRRVYELIVTHKCGCEVEYAVNTTSQMAAQIRKSLAEKLCPACRGETS